MTKTEARSGLSSPRRTSQIRTVRVPGIEPNSAHRELASRVTNAKPGLRGGNSFHQNPMMFVAAAMKHCENHLEMASQNDRTLPTIDSKSRTMAQTTHHT